MSFVGGPPARIERLLRQAVASSPYADDIVGDLREDFCAVASTRGTTAACLWYSAAALRLAARFGVRSASARLAGATRGSGGGAMDRLRLDVRLAVRSLVKRPWTAAAIVVTLTLGIGANASVFGIVDALLLHPFAMRDVDRVVMPVTTSPKWATHRETVSAADFLDWRQRLAGGPIDHLAAIDWWDANLVGRDEPERVPGFFVSPAFFAALDARPAMGRTFLADEEIPANARRIVLSDALWRRRFGADPTIVGQPVLIDGNQWTVVGVMPRGFDFPMRAELWAPLAFGATAARNRSNHYLTVIGRLAPGRTIDDARVRFATVVERLAREYPDSNREFGADLLTLSRGMTDVGLPQVLALWQAAGLFVLLIACANIANLLLARASEREREIAIRLALGSSRARIVRGALLESIVLVVAAIGPALATAAASLRVMQALMPARIVRFVAGWDRLGLDATTVGATLACAAFATVACGILPAIHISRGIVADALKSDGRTGAGPGRQRLRRTLVVAEIALVLPLLVAAMMSISTVTRFLTGWQGYDPDNVLTLRVVLPDARYPDAASRGRFIDNALDRFAAIPGARAVAAANILPAVDSNTTRSIEIAGMPAVGPGQRPAVAYRAVSPRYFDVVRTPITTGRSFDPSDAASAEPVAIVSESMARKYWPSGDALGQRVRVANGPWMRVVGVCGDIVHDWFDAGRGRTGTLYLPIAQAPVDSFGLAIRTAGDPLSVAAAARAAIARTDPMQPVFDVMSLRQVLSDRTVSLRYIAGVMGSFAAIALVLALVGLYAVMTFLVARRVREIGVRIALGATASDVLRLTLAQSARLTGAGVLVGLLLAVALGRAMEAGLLGIVHSDLRVTAGLAAALALTAVAASYVPARRAATIDPIVTLRSE